MTKGEIKALLSATASERLVEHIMYRMQEYKVEGVVNPTNYKYKAKDTTNFFIFVMEPQLTQLTYRTSEDRVFAVRHGKSGKLFDHSIKNTTWADCVANSYKMIVLTPKKG